MFAGGKGPSRKWDDRISNYQGRRVKFRPMANYQNSISKVQINTKPQIPNRASAGHAGIWSFGIGASLAIGHWSFQWFRLQCLLFSFTPERFHRIELAGAAGGEPRGEEADGHQHDNYDTQ